MSVLPKSPRARLDALSEAERGRWLDPAEREFVAEGFEAASLNRIIAEAGESKGRTYHYFADKGELFRAVFERRVARLGPLGLEAVEGAGFWKQLAGVAERLTGAFQSDTVLAALVRTLHAERAAQAACAVPLIRLRQVTGAVLARGQAAGAVRDDLPLSLLVEVALDLIVAVDRWFAMNASEMDPEAEAEVSRRAFTLLMAPLLPLPEMTNWMERPLT